MKKYSEFRSVSPTSPQGDTLLGSLQLSFMSHISISVPTMEVGKIEYLRVNHSVLMLCCQSNTIYLAAFQGMNVTRSSGSRQFYDWGDVMETWAIRMTYYCCPVAWTHFSCKIMQIFTASCRCVSMEWSHIAATIIIPGKHNSGGAVLQLFVPSRRRDRRVASLSGLFCKFWRYLHEKQ